MFLFNGKMGTVSQSDTENQEITSKFQGADTLEQENTAAEINLELPTSVSTENEPPTPVANKKPRGGIALALGGGAAKGWAHIGVLRAFEEAQIPVRMIAGTSIGALVGGCFLAGKLDELEEFARSMTFSGMIRFMDFSIRGAGLISGQRLSNRMAQHLGGVQIEDLDRDFVSICTDIRTGHEIWLHDGPLVEAIRASYALPGVFMPVEHNGRHLVDGAIVNPVPVSACRAYEPDIVIAIDLNSEAFGRATVIKSSHYETTNVSQEAEVVDQESGDPSANAFKDLQVQPKSRLGTTGVMMEAFNIIQDRIARARMAGDPPDYVVRPRLYQIGLADFHKADESIAIGYREAKLRICELTDEGSLETV